MENKEIAFEKVNRENFSTLEWLRERKKRYEFVEGKGYVIYPNWSSCHSEFGLPKSNAGFIPQPLGYIDKDTLEIIYYDKDFQKKE